LEKSCKSKRVSPVKLTLRTPLLPITAQQRVIANNMNLADLHAENNTRLGFLHFPLIVSAFAPYVPVGEHSSLIMPIVKNRSRHSLPDNISRLSESDCCNLLPVLLMNEQSHLINLHFVLIRDMKEEAR